MKSYFLLRCLMLLIGSTAPFASAIKADESEVVESDRKLKVSTFHHLDIQEGRILKKGGKVKKTKAPVKKKSKSKSPQKRSCYTNEESGDFINALTSAANSGASSVEIVICDGNTIDIPSPIEIYLESDGDSRITFPRIAQIAIGCAGYGCALLFTAGTTTGISSVAGTTASSVISFRRRLIEVEAAKANLSIFLDRLSLSSQSVAVASFFDVSDVVKETTTGTTFTVTMNGSYIVGEKVSSPILYSKEGLPCNCDSACIPERV